MELTVIRYSSKDESTLGLLLINGTFVAYTLEDEARTVKVQNETRIPSGRYQVKFRKEGGHHGRYLKNFGADFHKGMLQITGVPNFTWILIHIGNTDDDTAGCLLVGDASVTNVKEKGRINNSKNAYKRIYPVIANVLEMGETVWISYLDNIPLHDVEESKEEFQEATVITEQLNLRRSPGGQRQGVFFEDAKVEIIEERNGWSRVSGEGWVSSTYIDRNV